MALLKKAIVKSIEKLQLSVVFGIKVKSTVICNVLRQLPVVAGGSKNLSWIDITGESLRCLDTCLCNRVRPSVLFNIK
jgi:hypothetical protein